MPSASACSNASKPAPLGLAASFVLALGLALGPTACAHSSGKRPPPVSMLEINTETTDADVWVDGEYIGQVEAVSGRLKLAPGTHRVEVRKPGHFPVQRTVTVDRKGGGSVAVDAQMLPDPR